jgi:hypothetical protein
MQKIVEFLVRSYYRLFHKKRVFTVKFSGGAAFRFGDYITTPDRIIWMSLGKGYFLVIKKQTYIRY